MVGSPAVMEPSIGGAAPKPPGYLKPADDKFRIAARYRRGRRWSRPVMRPGPGLAPGRSRWHSHLFRPSFGGILITGIKGWKA